MLRRIKRWLKMHIGFDSYLVIATFLELIEPPPISAVNPYSWTDDVLLLL